MSGGEDPSSPPKKKIGSSNDNSLSVHSGVDVYRYGLISEFVSVREGRTVIEKRSMPIDFYWSSTTTTTTTSFLPQNLCDSVSFCLTPSICFLSGPHFRLRAQPQSSGLNTINLRNRLISRESSFTVHYRREQPHAAKNRIKMK